MADQPDSPLAVTGRRLYQCRMQPESLTPEQILRWYLDAGVDEAVGDLALDRFALTAAAQAAAAPAQAGPPRRGPAMANPGPHARAPEIIGTAAHIAGACKTLRELEAALQTFDGCALRKSCQSTVFGTGDTKARLMIVGEAPGADEDRMGLPFVGASGRLLDRMLRSIGLNREEGVYITNVVPWRPPGNRKPELSEVQVCLPFVQRHIELIDPQVLLLLGGAAANALLANSESISRLRGRWHDYSSRGLPRPVAAMATYHPAFLLRTPASKREAWRDLLAIKQKLSEHPPGP